MEGITTRVVRSTRKQFDCDVHGCDREHYGRGMCKIHYDRVRHNGVIGSAALAYSPAKGQTCTEVECNLAVRCKTRCPYHYRQWLRNERTEQCTVGDCPRGLFAKGLCRRHYESFLKKPARRLRHITANGEASAEAIVARVAYFGWRCWMCKRPFEAIDHVKPLSKGGSHWPSNLRPACNACNSGKKDRWPL